LNETKSKMGQISHPKQIESAMGKNNPSEAELDQVWDGAS